MGCVLLGNDPFEIWMFVETVFRTQNFYLFDNITDT